LCVTLDFAHRDEKYPGEKRPEQHERLRAEPVRGLADQRSAKRPDDQRHAVDQTDPLTTAIQILGERLEEHAESVKADSRSDEIREKGHRDDFCFPVELPFPFMAGIV